MRWVISHRFDRRALPMADRHYSRGKPGSPQFVRPSYNVVLLTKCERALWVSVRQKFVRHAWPGAWECATFRNEESGHLSSELIREAVAATRAMWGDVPPAGMITTVNAAKVRRKRDPGRCFIRAGWRRVGTTKAGALVFRLDPGDANAPPAVLPCGVTAPLFSDVRGPGA